MRMLRILVVALLAVTTVSRTVMAEDIGWHAEGRGGAVAAGGAEATAAGITILKQGGNAADAAAATLIALAATDVGFFVIGAEVPIISFDAQGNEVKVFCGLGTAPLDPKAMEWYYENGIPRRKNIKRAPVPAALSGIFELVKQHGTMSFEQIVAPTLALLDTGWIAEGNSENGKIKAVVTGDAVLLDLKIDRRSFDVNDLSNLEAEIKSAVNAAVANTKDLDGESWFLNLAKTYRKLIETERNTTGTREEKLQAARDRFYKGDIADDLDAFYRSAGSFLRKKDLASYVTHVEDPVSIDYRGYTVYKVGPWTQGPMLLETLRLLEGFDLKGMGHMSADYIHVLTEGLKLGFADRDEYYGDPLFIDVPMDELLSDEYTELRRPLIDMEHASKEIRPGDPINMQAVVKPIYERISVGGTTTCLVADRWGNFVSATPSGNPSYYVDPVTGVPHGNRLCQLNTMPGHPDRIEPGKRPRITLTPTLVLKDGKASFGVSVAGGDTQDQTALICMLNLIEFGILPKDSVMAPRFSTGHRQSTFDPNPNRAETLGGLGGLSVENNVPDDVISDLKSKGHTIRRFDGANSHPVMLYVDQDTGIMYAAGDHRVNRHAAVVEPLTP